MSLARRFTYGAQFYNEKTPLRTLLKFASQCSGDRAKLQETVRSHCFDTHGNASKTLAGNCVLSMNAYGLISLKNSGKNYDLTPLATELLERADDSQALFEHFSIHILLKLDGLLLLRIIENMQSRGEQVTVEAIGDELNDQNIELPTNSTYVSTMRGWLARAGIFQGSGYSIRWEVVDRLLGIDTDTILRLYRLTVEQKYFLLSMAHMGVITFTQSNQIAHHTRNIYSIKITTKSLVKDIIEPLVATGLVESQKATEGRGAKPHQVRLSAAGQTEVLAPLVESIAQTSGLQVIEINRTFADVVEDLKSLDKYQRGIALELLAIWIIRLLGLRFSKWRARSFQETGGGEVDVIAASDKIVYSRWQIQAKNTQSNVDIETIAKEVGMTFLTHADIVMVVTTARFTNAAIDYANQVTDTSRYYVILLDGEDIARIVADRAKIVDILNAKARRVFAKRELGISTLDTAQDTA